MTARMAAKMAQRSSVEERMKLAKSVCMREDTVCVCVCVCGVAVGRSREEGWLG